MENRPTANIDDMKREKVQIFIGFTYGFLAIFCSMIFAKVDLHKRSILEKGG